MLVKEELVRKKVDHENGGTNKKQSPLDQALDDFKKENGYNFLDMINDEKIRRKHLFKQLQKDNYNDDDFLKHFQNKQGE